ncbi:MAG: exo-alpha-sialidase [Acidobacteria bacterium]|nr:exo-alpha-sialidase [Acidobacteriota bacterium]
MYIATLAVAALVAQSATGPTSENIVVYREAGRFGGWPANHGIWHWGNEILAGFSAAWWQQRPPDRHQMDGSKPEEPRLARSLDGGRTWKIETPASLLPPEQGGSAARPLDHPMPLTAPGFAMTLRFADNHVGPSRLWYTTDRGKTWRGPFDFPPFGTGVAARTDYLIDGPREATVFVTVGKRNRREGRPLCLRTRDGGLHWEEIGWIGDEPAGFAIMPSSLRLSPTRLFTAIRVKQEPENWVEGYVSGDNGAHWTSTGRIAATGDLSGNPAHLIRLKDGRFCVTYGYRSKPYSIRARLGRGWPIIWGPEITVRDGAAAWDIGYPRSVQRPDGRIVTLYYYNDAPHNERFIEATLWHPPKD